MRWCQVGVKSVHARLLYSKNPCKREICRSGTPYEQDLDLTPSSGPRQLYSLDTVFGQQDAEAQGTSSSILGCTSPRCIIAVRSKSRQRAWFQEIIGHANIRQKMDTYSHVLHNIQQQAAERMDSMQGLKLL